MNFLIDIDFDNSWELKTGNISSQTNGNIYMTLFRMWNRNLSIKEIGILQYKALHCTYNIIRNKFPNLSIRNNKIYQ